ncbi:protease modulator HflC [Corallincola spongiicola]|uniref:Protein HflC n=1 Tax=Corallincola spongiicola TaxID=2520508 RepID=A0ABY1WQY7_9GAMM|nr:protease modulator HflC [Corallincola spongiicola]TAA47013.1 protease modulator HflC [Corallincola spongiicola]
MQRIGVVLIALIAVLFYSSVFVVKEGERGIVERFKKVIRGADGLAVVYEPGIQFKIPLIDGVKILDARLQTLSAQENRFITKEKKDLLVDSYAKWRIKDFAKYYLATGGDRYRAEGLLELKITNGLRTEFGTRTIQEIVSGERDDLMAEALSEGAESAKDLGIEVVDVRVKTINLPEEIRDAIFNRMRTEREVVAREHRSKGREQAEIIMAEVDRRVTVMLADAERQSRTLRGEGDASAAQVFADAYNKDPEFFAFLRSLRAYRESFANKGDILVIRPDSEFFQYMKQAELK